MTPDFSADPLLIQALAEALLHFLWQGALIALVVYLALGRMRSASANARHLVALAGLTLMALAVPTTTLWLWSEPGAATTSAQSGEVKRLLVAIAPGGDGFEPWSLWIVCLWLAGALVTATRTSLAWFGLWQIRRAADFDVPEQLRTLLTKLRALMDLPDRVRIGQSRAVPGPLVMGWLKPVLLLPPSLVARLPAGQLEMILAHELAHLRRADHWINLFQIVIETLLFYHPAVGWVSRRIRIERENACDDLVVSVTGRKLEYVEMLASLERWRRPGPSLALGVGDGQILTRIQRLVERRGEPRRARGNTLGLLAAILATLGLGSGPMLESWLSDQSPATVAPEPIDQRPTAPSTPPNLPDTVADPPGSAAERTVHAARSEFDRSGLIEPPVLEPTPEPVAEPVAEPASQPEPQPEPSTEATAAVERQQRPTARESEPGPEPARPAAAAPPSRPQAVTGTTAQPPQPGTVPTLPTDMLLAANLPTPTALTDSGREQDPATAPVETVAREAVVTGGALVQRTEPNYPRRALVRQIGGVVEVELEIDTDGSVGAVDIVSESPAGYGFGKAAAQAARRWRFEPFERGGDPIRHHGRVELRFEPGNGCNVPTGTRIRSC